MCPPPVRVTDVSHDARVAEGVLGDVAPLYNGSAGTFLPAELFHEVLQHRSYMSERAGTDVPIRLAIRDYIDQVLPDQKAVLGVDTVELPVVAMFDD